MMECPAGADEIGMLANELANTLADGSDKEVVGENGRVLYCSYFETIQGCVEQSMRDYWLEDSGLAD